MVLLFGTVCFFNFTQYVILDLTLLGVKGSSHLILYTLYLSWPGGENCH